MLIKCIAQGAAPSRCSFCSAFWPPFLVPHSIIRTFRAARGLLRVIGAQQGGGQIDAVTVIAKPNPSIARSYTGRIGWNVMMSGRRQVIGAGTGSAPNYARQVRPGKTRHGRPNGDWV